jgi:glucoamylase
MREGPVTQQDRWEEAAGFSPSTLAINIAGLICAAELLAAGGDHETADFVREYADFLESHVEAWTVTTEGTLLPGVARHYIRVNPNADGQEDPNAGTVILTNQPPGGPFEYPAKDIVDPGFLELVRYGVRDAQDPIIVDSLRVVDAVLKVDLPQGPAWRRYNHDGYGQLADGSSFKGWGIGRPWPLLTGERAHYELAAGRDAHPYVRALQGFAVGIGLISEQVWDEPAIPEKLLAPGGPTGAAIPLAWAHAEYIKLVRSVADGCVLPDRAGARALRQSRPEQRAAVGDLEPETAGVVDSQGLAIPCAHGRAVHAAVVVRRRAAARSGRQGDPPCCMVRRYSTGGVRAATTTQLRRRPDDRRQRPSDLNGAAARFPFRRSADLQVRRVGQA